MYFPTRIKQISLLPSDVMLVWWDGDEQVYRDVGAVIGYIAVIDGNKEDDYGNRIVNSGTRSNCWCEVPLTYQSERNLVHHDYYTEVLIVVIDTLIDERSRLIRVARKDVELMPEGW